MTPRPELIMQAIKARLTSLTTTGARVFRGRAYPLHHNDMPCIVVYMGDDRVASQSQTGTIDWQLTAFIECYVRTTASQVDTVANEIRKEVHAALMVDYDLGLSYVIDVLPKIALQPEISDDGSKPMLMAKLEYEIMYRTSRGAIDA